MIIISGVLCSLPSLCAFFAMLHHHEKIVKDYRHLKANNRALRKQLGLANTEGDDDD